MLRLKLDRKFNTAYGSKREKCDLNGLGLFDGYLDLVFMKIGRRIPSLLKKGDPIEECCMKIMGNFIDSLEESCLPKEELFGCYCSYSSCNAPC